MKLNKQIEKLLLAKNGGNKSELARFCAVTPQAVQQWIEGKTSPRGRRLNAIAEFFGISESQLVYGKAETGEIDKQNSVNAQATKPDARRLLSAIEALNDSQREAIFTMLKAFGAL